MNATSKSKDAQTSKPAKTKRLHKSYVQSDGFLARLEKSVPWEEFRTTLEEAKEEENATGRKGYDKLTLFKCLILQEAYGLSDKGLESALKDRLSFRFFTGIDLSPSVPDRLTIMRFRNRLATNDLRARLFTRLYSSLKERGLSLYIGIERTVSDVRTPRLRRARKSKAT